MARATAEETDPYLAPAEDAPGRGIASDLLAVLRARKNHALAREAARRGAADLRRERPDLFWTRPRSAQALSSSHAGDEQKEPQERLGTSHECSELSLRKRRGELMRSTVE